MNTIVQKIATPIGFACASFVSLSTFGYIMDDIHKLHIRHIKREYDIKLQKLEELETENAKLKKQLDTFLRTKWYKL